MRSEKGGVILFILMIILLSGLIIGGAFLIKKTNILAPKTSPAVQNNYESNIGTSGDNSFYVKMDFSNTPRDPSLLKHHISHCNATPGHKWDGSNCIESVE